MVVSDLCIVGDPLDVGIVLHAVENRHFPTDNADDLTRCAFHIIRDELTVCSGIGQELLFIERLHQLKCLLCREAVIAVCLTLQGGQIVELRRIDRLLLTLERRNDGLLFIASRRNRICLVFGFDLLHVSRQPVLLDMEIEVFLLVEGGDLAFALYQHCQSGSLNTTNHELFLIERSEKPGAVDTDNPISLRPAESCFVELIIFSAVTQMIEALTNGSVLKGADPETLEGLGASSLVVDQTENQLTFASGIGGADKLSDALVLHEITQHLELLRFVLRNFKKPFLRHDGEIIVSPLGIAFIVGACISKPHEMTDTP